MDKITFDLDVDISPSNCFSQGGLLNVAAVWRYWIRTFNM